MNICVLGKETLDELETMVREIFSAVPTDGEPARSFAHLGAATFDLRHRVDPFLTNHLAFDFVL